MSESNPLVTHVNAALSQARAEGRREGLEAGAAAAKDLAQRWDGGEGSRTFNACMAIQDKLLEMAKEGGEAVGAVIGSAWELSDETKAQMAAIDANRANAARNADKPMFQNYGAGSLVQKEGGK